MRSILLAVLAFHWAMYFGAFAVAGLIAQPPAADGLRLLFTLGVAGAYSSVAALFLTLGVDCVVSGREGLPARTRVLSAAFAGGVLLVAFEAALSGPIMMTTALLAPAAGLAGSYAVFRLERERRRRIDAVNDNKSLGARLMAAGAARMALMCEPAETRKHPRAEVS
jgi:hypothetical protein